MHSPEHLRAKNLEILGLLFVVQYEVGLTL